MNPLVLLPGTLFWICLLFAVTTRAPVMTGLTVLIGLTTIGGFLVVTLSRSVAERNRKRRVWAEGVAGTATVLSARTDGSVGQDPYVELELAVDGRTAEVRQLVAQVMLSRVQPGEQVAVRTDPEDPDVVVIDPALTPRGY